MFQYDAINVRPDSWALILEYASRKLKADIMYFGYCFESFGIPKFLIQRRFKKYHPKVTGLPPHCLHAYAVTSATAATLIQTVHECEAPIDKQVAMLASKNVITFNFSDLSADTEFTKTQFAKYGVHWSNDQYGPNRDGIFAQVVMDEPPPIILDGTAVHDLGRERSVFVMYNHTWRHIPNMEVYSKVLGETRKGDVKVLTSWQFHHYAEGEALIDELVPEIRAIRDSMLLK